MVVLIPGAFVLLLCKEIEGGSATTLMAIAAELFTWTEETGVGRRCGTVVVPGTCKDNHLVTDRKPLEIHDVRACLSVTAICVTVIGFPPIFSSVKPSKA